MKYFSKIIGLFLLLLFFGIIPEKVDAAKIYFDPAEINLGEGDEVQVRIFLDTRGQLINALEMTIVYPQDILKLVGNIEKDSIVSLWVEVPEEKEAGRIIFSGLVPGGFQGERGLVGVFIFKTAKRGEGKITVSDFEILLNDKKGTSLSTVAGELNVSVGLGQDMKTGQSVSVVDNNPPDEFRAEVVRFPELFFDQWSLVFEAQDGITGIDHYEIQETLGRTPADADWIRVDRGPYLLTDQKLRSFIHIRALDKNGNVRLVVLPPRKPLISTIFFSVVILVALLIIFKIRKK